MTWHEFCANAQQDTPGANGYQLHSPRELRSIEESTDVKRQAAGTKWLRQHAPRVRRKWAEPGYYGRTRGEWFPRESDGAMVLQFEQTAVLGAGVCHDSAIIALRAQGLGRLRIARKLSLSLGTVQRRIEALGLQTPSYRPGRPKESSFPRTV